MKKKERKKILKNLSNQIRVVDQPDHPNVLNGPDILGQTEDRLYGLFLLNLNSSNPVRDIEIRLAESSLNYPSKQLNYLLINDTKFDNNIITHLEKHFDKVITELDLKSKSIFLEKRSTKLLIDLKEQQSKYQKKYTKKLIYNTKIYNKKLAIKNKNFVAIKTQFADKEKASYNDWETGKVVKVRSNIYEYEKKYIAFKKIINNTPDQKDIEPYFKFGFLKDIKLEDKLTIFFKSHKKYLDVDKFPMMSSDPRKLIRIMSSSGWKITISESNEELFKYIDK